MFVINFNFLHATNENIFIKLNNFLNLFPHQIYQSINLILDYHYFYLHTLIYCLIITYKYKEKLTNINLDELFWAQRSIIFIALNLSIALLVKKYFSFTRPFCNNNITHIFTIKSLIFDLDCLQSFPSGHTTYIASILFVFWARVNIKTRIIFLLGLTLIAMTRIAAGAHYPSDILGAITLSYLIIIFCFKISAIYKKQILKINRFILDKINISFIS